MIIEYKDKNSREHIRRIKRAADEAMQRYNGIAGADAEDFDSMLLRGEIFGRRHLKTDIEFRFRRLHPYIQEKVDTAYSDFIDYNNRLIGMLEQAVSLGSEN